MSVDMAVLSGYEVVPKRRAAAALPASPGREPAGVETLYWPQDLGGDAAGVCWPVPNIAVRWLVTFSVSTSPLSA